MATVGHVYPTRRESQRHYPVDRKGVGLSLVLPAHVNDLVAYRAISARKHRHREAGQSRDPSALVWLTARPDTESLLQATVDVVGTARCFFTVSAFEIPFHYNETLLRTVRAVPSEDTSTAYHSSCGLSVGLCVGRVGRIRCIGVNLCAR